jgi:hypothetical protein
MNRIASFLFCFLPLVSLAAQVEFLPPHEVTPGSGMKVHYAHFHGDRQLEATIRKGDESMAQVFQCPNWPDVRPKEAAVVDTYIYSAQDRSIVIIHSELYQVGTDCKPHKTTDKTESHIRTSGSYCTLFHNSKIANGPCDLSAVARWDIDKAAATPNAGIKRINGLQCTFYSPKIFKGFDAGVCVADGGSFRAFPSHFSPLYVRGIPIELERDGNPNSELKEVKFDMDVNPALFTIPKDFKIKSGLTSGNKK